MSLVGFLASWSDEGDEGEVRRLGKDKRVARLVRLVLPINCMPALDEKRARSFVPATADTHKSSALYSIGGCVVIRSMDGNVYLST